MLNAMYVEYGDLNSELKLSQRAVRTKGICRKDRPEIWLLGNKSRGWRDGLTVKSTCCSCRGPEFGSQHPHCISPPFITPVSKDSAVTTVVYTRTRKQNTCARKVNNLKKGKQTDGLVVGHHLGGSDPQHHVSMALLGSTLASQPVCRQVSALQVQRETLSQKIRVDWQDGSAERGIFHEV